MPKLRTLVVSGLELGVPKDEVKKAMLRKNGRKPPQPPEQVFKRKLSPNQYALMRAIANGEAGYGDRTLEILNYTTFGALVRREYVVVDRRNNPIFTQKGLAAFQTYQEMGMPQRSHPGKVTKFVIDFLGLSQIRNGGA